MLPFVAQRVTDELWTKKTDIINLDPQLSTLEEYYILNQIDEEEWEITKRKNEESYREKLQKVEDERQTTINVPFEDNDDCIHIDKFKNQMRNYKKQIEKKDENDKKINFENGDNDDIHKIDRRRKNSILLPSGSKNILTPCKKNDLRSSQSVFVDFKTQLKARRSINTAVIQIGQAGKKMIQKTKDFCAPKKTSIGNQYAVQQHSNNFFTNCEE